MNEQPQSSEAELARLADGSLPASRQADVRAQVRKSPELAGALAEQERAVAMIRAVDVPAPDSLRAKLDALTASASATAPRRPRPRVRMPRLGWAAAGGLGTAVAAAVVLILALGGQSTGPSLAQAARAAVAPATAPSPAEDVANRSELRMSVAGVPFPYWGKSIGWRTAGARVDTLGGRRVTTVFYRGRTGVRIGYAIVPGSAVPVNGGRSVWRHGIRFTLLTASGARVVTWLRSGHTCVIAGQGVGSRTLLALATADVAGPVAAVRWPVAAVRWPVAS
jgi:hypothetical protein